MIDGAPEMVLHAIDLHEDLIEMPLPLSMLAHVRGALRSDLSREDWTKPINPESHTFMADIDASLVGEVFYVAKRERKPNIHHHRKLDDLG